jgi:hypothetical protein
MTAWTTVSDIRARARRRWDDGSILTALATASPFPVIDVPLRGPRPGGIGDDIEAVRAWISALQADSHDGARYTLRYSPVGGRLIGRNELPTRAVIETYEQAIRLMGVADKVKAYRAVLSAVAAEPAVAAWVAEKPLRALEVSASWPAILAAYSWLSAARGCGHYLREITAPGVDTKFVERHRQLLAQLLGVSSTASGFLTALGLRAKPDTLRIRPDPSLGIASGLSDLTVRADELAALPVKAKRALVIENEITFLTAPVPRDGVAFWGKGFEVDRVGALPWLAEADVIYWGDLDTHGFAILNQLRAWLPSTRSLLMDRETLLAHRDRWVGEASPAISRLNWLTAEEQALYHDLVADRLGERIRLEQERIDWNWAARRLADQVPMP